MAKNSRRQFIETVGAGTLAMTVGKQLGAANDSSIGSFVSSVVKRVDNFFYNTKDVASLAGYYSETLGIKIRRNQSEGPGLMWMEISVGGMELSFRRAGATPNVHPHLRNDFLEQAPGGGATISFEVDDTDRVRRELQKRGVKFRGAVIKCSGGKELISIFEDPFGRPVQLYESRFSSPTEAIVVGLRAGVTASMEFVASNRRDVRDMAMSVSFFVPDLEVAKQFYGGVLELPLAGEDQHRLSFKLEGTTIEFRKGGSPVVASLGLPKVAPAHGGTLAVEVRDMNVAKALLGTRGVTVKPLYDRETISTAALVASKVNHGILGNGIVNTFRDPDGNSVELWQR